MLETYRFHIGDTLGNHLQYGALSSSIAIFRNTNCAAFIICCGSLLGSSLSSRQPKRVSSATSPMHSNDHLWISLEKSFGNSLRSSSKCCVQRVMKSSVTFSSGLTYRRTVDSCKTGFWTLDLNSRHCSPKGNKTKKNNKLCTGINLLLTNYTHKQINFTYHEHRLHQVSHQRSLSVIHSCIWPS